MVSVNKTCYSYVSLQPTYVHGHNILDSHYKGTESLCLPAEELPTSVTHKSFPVIQFSYKSITNIMQWWVLLSTHRSTHVLLLYFFSPFYFAWISTEGNHPPALTLILPMLKHIIRSFFFQHFSIKRTFHVHNNECIYNVGVDDV